MKIQRPAIAGTLESSDAQISVEPTDTDLSVYIQSPVMNQYGQAIEQTVKETLKQLGVTTGRVSVVDQGALDCTLRARIHCAVFRSNQLADSDVPWGGIVR